MIKPPMHQSKYREAAKESLRSPNKKPHATMGPVKVDKSVPTEFVKKHTRDFDVNKPGTSLIEDILSPICSSGINHMFHST